MDGKGNSRRLFENVIPEEDKKKVEIVPDHGMMYLPAPEHEFISIMPPVYHGNVFDQPELTEEQTKMALKRLKDEGYDFGSK